MSRATLLRRTRHDAIRIPSILVEAVAGKLGAVDADHVVEVDGGADEPGAEVSSTTAGELAVVALARGLLTVLAGFREVTTRGQHTLELGDKTRPCH
jgi:hypothetical protein